MGHYVRTELKKVYKNIGSPNARYGIPVPITDAERQLFRNNTTNIEAEADMALEQISHDFYSRHSRHNHYIDSGLPWNLIHRESFLPNRIIKEYTPKGMSFNTIVKDLQKRNILGERDKQFDGNKQRRGYYINDDSFLQRPDHTTDEDIFG